MKVCLERLGLVLALLLVLLHLPCGLGERIQAPPEHWVVNAVADGAPSYVNGYQPAPGYPPGCYSNSGCDSFSIDYQPNGTVGRAANTLGGQVFLNSYSPVSCGTYDDPWWYYLQNIRNIRRTLAYREVDSVFM